MLEEYLEQIGVKPEDLYESLPEITDAVKDYYGIKDMDEEGYDDQLKALSTEIIEHIEANKDKLPRKETPVEEPVAAKAEGLSIDLPPIELVELPFTGAAEPKEAEPALMPIGLELPEMPLEEQAKSADKVGYKLSGVTTNMHIWMKTLSLLGMDYRWKVVPKYPGMEFWGADDDAYLATSAKPYDAPVDVYVFAADDKGARWMADVVKAKSLSYEDVSDVYERFDLEGANDAVTPDDDEPVTRMPYRQIDSTLLGLWRIKNQDDLVELIELSKKYGCGCGSL